MQISSSVNPTPDVNVSIEELVRAWTLNTEQARAFKIIASHSMEPKPKPLRMYIGGPGGTGKSRIIQALTDFFKRKNQSRRLRLTAFTGVAAKNIGGTTLHTALCMSLSKKKSDGNKTRTNLVAMWEGVDYMLVDEVSTVGCGLLVDVHDALVSATGSTDLFGGMSVIFAGDFAQLAPVLDTKLYTHLNHKRLHADTTAGQKTTFGKLLWRSVGTVVILTEQMRQHGEANKQFVSLLGRLREGICTDDDFSLLKSRLVSSAGQDLSTDEWRKAPIIVSENAVKDAINTRAAVAFAEQTRQTVQWFDAMDTYRGAKITDSRVREYLLTQPSGKTGQRLGKIPIALGMPVIVNQNFDVEGGLVNGSFGYVRDYRFQTDEDGIRTLTSCIVEIPDFTAEPLPHLPPRHVAIISDTVEMRSIVHPVSGRSCTMKRFQVPLAPGFAMTAHKAQGLTLPRVIIDLANCRGTEPPYVMASRCSNLSGLLIMRPFPMSKITCRRSQEARTEFARLDLLRWQVMVGRSEAEYTNTDIPMRRHPCLTTVRTTRTCP
jgi:flavin-binding protein dodecin